MTLTPYVEVAGRQVSAATWEIRSHHNVPPYVMWGTGKQSRWYPLAHGIQLTTEERELFYVLVKDRSNGVKQHEALEMARSMARAA